MTLQPEDASLDELATREAYQVVTADGWTLVITRYQAVSGDEPKPLLGVPLLLVHGFTQNRHAWTAGDFVKHLLRDGVDVHILELRGHGESSRALQRRLADEGVRPLPPSWRFHWDFSDYLLHDVPAAIDAVKARTGWSRIAYCGHSMGGILGYAVAAQRDDLLCLATIGSPVDLGSETLWIRLASRLDFMVPWLQAGVRGAERVRRGAEELHDRFGAGRLELPRLPAHVIPFDLLLGGLYRSVVFAHERAPWWLPRPFRLFNPDLSPPHVVERLLRVGEEKEPAEVLTTFTRWVRLRELKCYRTGFDIRAGLRDVRIPVAMLFGSDDVLAGERCTRPAFTRVQSVYRTWRKLAANAHIDVTAGPDTRLTCQDIRELMLHALGR